MVDIRTTSGLLKEEGGTLIAVAPEPRPIAETVEKTLSILDSMSDFNEPEPKEEVAPQPAPPQPPPTPPVPPAAPANEVAEE